MRKLLAIVSILFLFFIYFPQNNYAQEQSVDQCPPGNFIHGQGNCTCMQKQGRCYSDNATIPAGYTSQGSQNCNQNEGTCYTPVATPTTNLLSGTPTPTPPPIQNTQQGESIDQTVNNPGLPTPIPGQYTPQEWYVETEGTMQNYGDTCGIAGVDGKNSCCLNQMPAIHFKAPNGFAEILLGVVQGSVNFLIDKVNSVNQVYKFTMYDLSESVRPKGSSFPPDPFCYTGKASSFKPGGNNNPFTDISCICEEPTTGQGGTPNEAICNAFNDPAQLDPTKPGRFDTEKQQCINCFTGGGGVWTALGCVKTDFGTFVTQTIFGTGIGIAGIVALLCIIYSAFLMQTSQGNPEQITKAQEMLTSCITGLIMIIFSVLILRFIGVDLLGIPGLAGSSTGTNTVANNGTSTSVIPPTAVPGQNQVNNQPTVNPSVNPTALPTTIPTQFVLNVTTTVAPTATPVPTEIPTPLPIPTRSPDLNAFDCDPSTGPLPNEVYLYDNANYGGPCVRLPILDDSKGMYGLQAVSNASANHNYANWFWSCQSSFNDCVDSVKVGSGVKVTLYQDQIATDIPESGACHISTQTDIADLNKLPADNCTSIWNLKNIGNIRSNYIGDNISYVVIEKR